NSAYMITSRVESAGLAKKLMDDFADKTGINNKDTSSQDRYLWTDAFAVQNFLALSSFFDDDKYKYLARNLIGQVHETLGRFAPEDSRSGWISGLPEEEGQKHPTINGLRIGKDQLERKKTDPFDPRKEWDRDGQYFHYHTRWIHALLHAAQKLNDRKLITYASELSLAGRHFLESSGNQSRLYWKMSVDLSYPLVSSMGAHDPLDGYLTALECKLLTSNEEDFTEYLSDLESLCGGKSWQTDDPLGLGGLLLNVVRSAELKQHTKLPESVHPQKLYSDALTGLKEFSKRADLASSSRFRLAFRECGLSLGLRVVDNYQDKLADTVSDLKELEKKQNLADDIEQFWSQSENRKFSNYRDHLNINHVSLASSLLAGVESNFFSTPEFE
ncbi:MAG: hypothetical protein ACQETF_09250, partial [Bacteroidota bacterium]